MASGISNPLIDEIYETAIRNGATGGKVSGAGGGGFMFFYCPGNSRSSVIEALKKFGGQTKRYEFTAKGLEHGPYNISRTGKTRYSVKAIFRNRSRTRRSWITSWSADG